jgi:hypothetical protein
MLVGKGPCSTWLGPFSVVGMCMTNGSVCLCDVLVTQDCIRSVRVSSRTVYFYTRAGVEQACVEMRSLMGLLIGEEMWCICGMLQYSLKSKINLPHWHSVQHVRHILTDCHGVDAWSVNGAGISILARGSAGYLIRPNTPLSASSYIIFNFISSSCNVLVASVSFFYAQYQYHCHRVSTHLQLINIIIIIINR